MDNLEHVTYDGSGFVSYESEATEYLKEQLALVKRKSGRRKRALKELNATIFRQQARIKNLEEELEKYL